MVNDSSIVPKGERLRLAVRWLSENQPITSTILDEAAIRFDLAPIEAEFLRREFGGPGPTDSTGKDNKSL